MLLFLSMAAQHNKKSRVARGLQATDMLVDVSMSVAEAQHALERSISLARTAGFLVKR